MILRPNETVFSFTLIDPTVLLAIAAAIFAGIKASFNARISDRFKNTDLAKIRGFIPYIVTMPASTIVLGTLLFGIEGQVAVNTYLSTLQTSPDHELFWLVLIGVLIFGLGAPSFNIALANKPTNEHASIFYITPVLATLLLILVNGEEVTYFVLSGALLTLGTVFFLSTGRTRIDPLLGSALVTLVTTYVLVLLKKLITHDASGITDNAFVAESALLVFGLVIVYGIERLGSVRVEHENRFGDLMQCFMTSQCGWSEKSARDKIDDLALRLSWGYFGPTRRLPQEYSRMLNADFAKLSADPENHDQFRVHLNNWLVARNRFFPHAHMMFYVAFGALSVYSVVLYSSWTERDMFLSTLVTAAISYMVFYIINMNGFRPHPGETHHCDQAFEKLQRAIYRPKDIVEMTWVGSSQPEEYRSFPTSIRNVGDVSHEKCQVHSVKDKIPLFIRWFPAAFFLISVILFPILVYFS